jgi:hypothetical protein
MSICSAPVEEIEGGLADGARVVRGGWRTGLEAGERPQNLKQIRGVRCQPRSRCSKRRCVAGLRGRDQFGGTVLDLLLIAANREISPSPTPRGRSDWDSSDDDLVDIR